MTDNTPWKRPEGKPVRRIPETYFPYSAATSERLRKIVPALIIVSVLCLGFIAAVGLILTLGAVFGRVLGVLIILAIVWTTFHFGGQFRPRMDRGRITWKKKSE